MKTLNKIRTFSILLVTLLTTQNIFSQSKETSIEQDEKIKKLLLEKRKNNSGITINDKFKIQIFFGNIEESKKIPFEKLLFGLGIRYVGETVAKKLARAVKNIDNLVFSKQLKDDENKERMLDGGILYFLP